MKTSRGMPITEPRLTRSTPGYRSSSSFMLLMMSSAEPHSPGPALHCLFQSGQVHATTQAGVCHGFDLILLQAHETQRCGEFHGFFEVGFGLLDGLFPVVTDEEAVAQGDVLAQRQLTAVFGGGLLVHGQPIVSGRLRAYWPPWP